MAAEDIIARLRRGYDAFNRQDFDAVLADLEPGFEGEERAESPERARFQGRDAALRAFRALHDEFEDYRFEPREFIPEGEHMIVVLRQSGRGRLSGVPVEGDIVHVWRFSGARSSGLRAFSTVEEARAFLRAS